MARRAWTARCIASSCVWQETMISLRMFVEFIRRGDVDKVRSTLNERRYDLDQTDDVSVQYILIAFKISCTINER